MVGGRLVKLTRYFQEQVLRKRPFINVAQCRTVIAWPLGRIVQADGRVRHWGRVIDSRDQKSRILREVTLEDGETIHNAFFDRDFRED
jgi:hypothetical protein